MMIAEQVSAAADVYLWKTVSENVANYVKAGRVAASLMKKATARFPRGAGYPLLAPMTGDVWILRHDVLPSKFVKLNNFDDARWEKLARLDEISSVTVSDTLPKDIEGWVFLPPAGMGKEARLMTSDIGRWPYEVWKATGAPMGGHNPVTGAIAGGALGGLGGYALGKGLGWLIKKPLHWLMPDYFDDEKETAWGPMMGILGAGVGAGLPLWAGSARGRAHGTPFLNRFASTPEYPGVPKFKETTASVLDKFSHVRLGHMEKNAINGYGPMFRPTIDTSRFVDDLNNSMTAINGNSYSPAAAAGTMAGLVSGASAARGVNWVSPMDIARMAMGAGSGLVSGIIVGKIAGGLAGLRPSAQKKLRRVGLWSGLLSTAARTLF